MILYSVLDIMRKTRIQPFWKRCTLYYVYVIHIFRYLIPNGRAIRSAAVISTSYMEQCVALLRQGYEGHSSLREEWWRCRELNSGVERVIYMIYIRISFVLHIIYRNEKKK